MASVDEISPPYVGEDKLVLALADPQASILANVPFQVDVDYSAAEPNGLELPMVLILQAPDGSETVNRKFSRSFPSSLLLKATMRGQHFILLRELYHNRWQGRLIVDVEGEDLQTGEERVF